MNHKLQINLWHCEEEPHTNHETTGRHTKQCNKLSLPHQDDCKTRTKSNAQPIWLTGFAGKTQLWS